MPMLFPSTLDLSEALSVNIGGIPYLAKNERDMGHPSFIREREGTIGIHSEPQICF